MVIAQTFQALPSGSFFRYSTVMRLDRFSVVASTANCSGVLFLEGIAMTELRKRPESLQLRGCCNRTQECYVRAVISSLSSTTRWPLLQSAGRAAPCLITLTRHSSVDAQPPMKIDLPIESMA